MNSFDKDPVHDYTAPRRAPVPLIVGLVVAIVFGLGVAVVALSSSGGGNSNDQNSASSNESPRLANGAGPDVAATQPPEAPTPEPTPLPPPPTPEPAPAAVPQLTNLGSGDRLSIPKFGINAPLTYKSVGPNGQMPDPEGSDDVAYYNFSNFPGFGGAPGKGGNAVFAGHVDSGHNRCDYGKTPPPCAAVLWNLSKVAIGDEVSVQISGSVFTYRVISATSVSETADWQPIVSATSKESITIITCGGSFNARTHSYDSRQVVKAERV